MMPTIEITEDTFKGLQMLAQPLVDTADSVIARLVEEALRENDPAAKAKRQSAVAEGTWEARASWVGDLIEKVLLKKSV